jgi:hypothetical protein
MEEVFDVISNYFDVLVSSWLILVPVALFFIFFSKLSSKLSFALAGFYTAYVFVIPLLIQVNFVKDLIDKYSEYQSIIYFVFSLLVAVSFYFVFQYLIVIGGVVIGGFFGYTLGNFLIASQTDFFESFNVDLIFINVAFMVVMGIIFGIVLSKTFDLFISGICIIFGSLILSFYALYGIMKNTELEIGNNYFLDTAKEITSTEKFIYFGIVIFFCIIGFGLLFRKKRK